MYFCFHYFDGGLLHRQIRHLNIQPMKMNSFQTFAHVVGKFWLANTFDAGLVGDRAGLMKVPKQIIKINNGSGVGHEFVPIATFTHRPVIAFICLNYFLKVPRKCKNKIMFLFAKR